jgi:hypothetical protein
VFKFSFLYHNGVFRGEDWGYFAQSYEAARVSILHYHQFPWWNAWMNGGQPLFANPQFGLLSIQMPLVLLFGTVSGLHYSLFVYYILGFWGMYILLKRLGSNSKLITVLLTYIWLFSGFSAWHLGGGQLTFALYLLVPWALLTTLNIHKKFGWAWFGLVMSVFILSAMHYLTIETIVVCVAVAAFQVIVLIRSKKAKKLKDLAPILKPYTFAAILIIILCASRLVYTLQFTHEYPRLSTIEPAESLRLFLASMTFRNIVDPSLLTGGSDLIRPYGWSEYANYFGIITLALFVYLVIRNMERIRSIKIGRWLLLGSILLSALVSLGSFSTFSPYALIHNLPLFDQMRVPSRFICWVGLGVILFLAKLPHKPIIYVLLVFSAVDVFAASYSVINYPETKYVQTSNITREFEQQEFFQTDPSLGQVNIMNLQNFRLLRATQVNRGEIYGYEPVLNIGEYYYIPGPARCGINHGCQFVLTKNAKVTSWSPQNISLERTGSGPIKLNMNPGKAWFANNKALFPDYRIIELQKNFVINDSSVDIDVTYKPVLR